MSSSQTTPKHVVDMEDLRKVAQSVYARNAELVKLDKMKDEFVALASHELRTPLTIVKNYLWLALHEKNEPLGSNTTKYIDIAAETVDRLMFLVEDILTISRIENGRVTLAKENVDMVPFVRGVVESYQLKAQEKQVQLSFESSIDSQMVTFDKNRFTQVVVNILGNALKFTPVGGEVRVSVTIQDATTCVIRVSDTGPGIPPDKHTTLFTKFGKIDDSYANLPNVNGTGLGLYISKEIMLLHEGTLTAESVWGKGSTFIASLPISQ